MVVAVDINLNFIFMYSNYGYMMGHGFSAGGIMAVILWIAIIFFIFYCIRMMRSQQHHCNHAVGNTDSHALDILKERYAKGEIQKEEFDTKRKDLS